MDQTYCYGVATGQYSSFHIHAVFATREEAEQCVNENFTTASGTLAEALNLDSGAEIVEIPFGSLGETVLYRIYVTLASAHIHIERQMAAPHDTPHAWIWASRAVMNKDDNEVTLNILTPARSIEHAVHIATELRMRLITLMQTTNIRADRNYDITGALLKILEDSPAPATS